MDFAEFRIQPCGPPLRYRNHQWRIFFRRLIVCCVLLIITAAELSAQITTPGGGVPGIPARRFQPVPSFNQFSDFTTPPYAYDQIRGEIVNLETQQVKPIMVTQDGEIVAVANDVDGRVVFFDADLNFLAETRVGQGICSIVERPGLFPDAGEFWVTTSHQTATLVIRRGDFTISHVIRPNITNGKVGPGHASTPAGIDFNHESFLDSKGNLLGIGDRAYVAAKQTNALLVIDTNSKSVIKVIELQALHNGRFVHLNEPRSVVQFEGKIWISSHLSGNESTTSQSLDPAIPGITSILGPDDVTIVDLSDDTLFPNRSLPDFDVAQVDLVSGQVTMVRGLYSVGFGMAAVREARVLAIGAFQSHNGQHTGEGAFPNGAVVTNGIAGFRSQAPQGFSFFLPTELLGPAQDNLVMPIDLATDTNRRVYVAGYGSSNVGVYLANGLYFGTIDTDDGPAGVAVSNSRNRLYVYCRIEGTVQSFDTSSLTSPPSTPITTVNLFDPTFDDVKEGRRIFNTPNSGNMATNCASCHPEGRKDGIAWNLSKFFDEDPGPATEFKDHKGVTVTQDLRNLWGSAPYHWRGEQADIDSFNGAFEGLLKGSLISQEEMDTLKSYFFSQNFPPNPLQQMNRSFSPRGLTGFDEYTSTVTYRCDQCHHLPLGTDSSITEGFIGFPTGFTMETTHLVGIWSKESDIANTDDLNPSPSSELPLAPTLGFGSAHEGAINNLLQFNRLFFPNKDNDSLTQFIFEMDSGLAPVTSYSRPLNITSTGIGRISNYMMSQAAVGNGDLVASGRLLESGNWIEVGLLYDTANNNFQADTSSLGTFTLSQLRAKAMVGEADLYFYGVPVWSGERLALDRDRDGVRDGDEIAQGLNPRDPDTDGDGLWDGLDSTPNNPNVNVLPTQAPQVVPGSVQVIFQNTNNVKIQYMTDSWSPSRIEFGDTSALGFFSGDPVLPVLSANNSNLWKRKHTALLRPQPSQGLMGLLDDTTYDFNIITQGQGGLVASTAASLVLPNLPKTDVDNHNFNSRRVSSILLTGASNPNGTFTYTAVVELINGGPGNPVGSGHCVPGRFAIYDSNGAFTTIPMAQATNNLGQAIYTFTTAPGQQITGDRVRFDVPMVMMVSDCNGNPPDNLAFPGHWPEGPSCTEINAP